MITLGKTISWNTNEVSNDMNANEQNTKSAPGRALFHDYFDISRMFPSFQVKGVLNGLQGLISF